jgi:hypothetical protein
MRISVLFRSVPHRRTTPEVFKKLGFEDVSAWEIRLDTVRQARPLDLLLTAALLRLWSVFVSETALNRTRPEPGHTASVVPSLAALTEIRQFSLRIVSSQRAVISDTSWSLRQGSW